MIAADLKLDDAELARPQSRGVAIKLSGATFDRIWPSCASRDLHVDIGIDHQAVNGAARAFRLGNSFEHRGSICIVRVAATSRDGGQESRRRKGYYETGARQLTARHRDF